MAERRELSDAAITELMSRLASLERPWTAERVAAHLGWTVLSQSGTGATFDCGLGDASGCPGFADLAEDGTASRVVARVSVADPPNTADPDGTRDAFARLTALATGVLGEPAERIHQGIAQVRWHIGDTTIRAIRSARSVNADLMATAELAERPPRVRTATEIAGLIGAVRALGLDWGEDEADLLAARLAWKKEDTYAGHASFDSGLGMLTGGLQFKDGRLVRMTMHACTWAGDEGRLSRAFVQDAFAHSVHAVGVALGPPTRRVHGEDPEVRWRGETMTVMVRRAPRHTSLVFATNAYVDRLDWLEENGP
ncbi:DUF6301 family protein [Actinomadura macrotermitis]|uniref:Uncharacterized protein n=1 Tax=Actinomadura macrotermitis TaxID=2585200 RepID=A0A7K0C4U6_9ACTN|nr:DUF6301 family protein [Actinomadura macrotermitis]MQY08463.1 hypothetical protein [Actinomadura macrotermitis]